MAIESPSSAQSSPSPLEQLQAQERELQLAAALEKLSAEHREVLIARHFEDRSFTEIARQLQRSEPAARMLWIRALRALRRAFEPGAGQSFPNS